MDPASRAENSGSSPATASNSTGHARLDTIATARLPPTRAITEATMILRSWTARTTPELEPSYIERVRNVVLPYLEAQRGFLGAHFGSRKVSGDIEILVITRWDSMEAVHRFSGNEQAHAYMPAAIAETLTSYDTESTHHEVLLEVDGPNPIRTN